jgi:CRISPR-associated protein Cas5t
MIILRVEVPVACFRQSHAREYLETYPVPPPSTVYGMLLSLIGETDRYLHCGVRLAIALTKVPEKSTVLRTVHRFKKRTADPSNIRPDYQEILTDVDFFVWINSDLETANTDLSSRLHQAFDNPSLITRFGGLSLGESRDLVNSIALVNTEKVEKYNNLYWLVKHENGQFILPHWVNHLGQYGTFWKRYNLQQLEQKSPLDNNWIEIVFCG